MANIPSLSELTSGQANPSLAFGSGYAGGVPPIDLSTPNLDNKLEQISIDFQKKKERDKAEYEKALSQKLSSINKIDQIHESDKDYILGKYKGLRDEIIKNADVFAPNGASKNPKKYAELESQIASFLSEVDKSKQDKKIEQAFLTAIRTRPELNNEETRFQYEKWRNSGIEREPFMPIDDGSKNLLAYEKEFFKEPASKEIAQSDIPDDPNSYLLTEYGIFDKNRYRSIFKEAKGDFYTSKYFRSPELQEEMTLEDYLNSEADNMFGNREKMAMYQTKKFRNEAMSEKGKDERAEANRDASFRRTEYVQGQQNARQEGRQEFVEESEQTKKGRAINDVLSDIRGADVKSSDNIEELVKQYPVLESNIPKGYKKMELLDETSIATNLSPIYAGGASVHGSAYGKLFRLIGEDNVSYYTPAKILYSAKNKYDQSVLFDNKKDWEKSRLKGKEEFYIPDLSKVYEEDDLALKLTPESKRPVSATSGSRTKGAIMFDKKGNIILE